MIEIIKYNKSAFTLIEITIALLILAVGLVGILTLFPVGFDASSRAANIARATFLAQELIEDLKREGYGGDTVEDAITQTAAGGAVYNTDELDAPYSNYQYEIRAYDAAEDVTGLREVVINVYWPADAGGPPPETRDNQRNVELNTYIAKYEP